MSSHIDQMGRNVHLSNTPQQIISLVPSQTELLFYLGLEEEVVGITKFCVHPEKQFRIKPRIGGTKQLKMDKIDALQPDLIIGNKEENEQSQIEALAEKYPVWMSDILTLEDAYDMMISIGNLTNRKKEAAALVKKIQFGFSKNKPLTLVPLTVAYFIWQKPYMVAAKETFIDNMLFEAGFKNAFEHKSRYPEISLAELSAVSPNVIFLSSEPFPFKEKHMEIFQNACPDAIIKLVDGELFSWYGNRLLLFLEYVEQLRADIQKKL